MPSKSPSITLPKICPSSMIYGLIRHRELEGVPLAGMLGDQQAALVGQACFRRGEMKNTYGTGCFLLMNTGEDAIPSRFGLLTTVAYKFGSRAPPIRLGRQHCDHRCARAVAT